MNKDLLKNSYRHQNQLSISVKNIEKFEKLMENVNSREKELKEALTELYQFNLVVSFEVEKDEQSSFPEQQNQDPL